MKIINKLFGLVILLSLFACNSNDYKSGDYSRTAYESDDQDVPVTTVKKNIEVGRKLITVGNVNFEVDNIDATRKKIAQAVTKNNGYISSETEDKSSWQIRNVMIIRVPAQNFDKLLQKISEGVNKFDSKNIEVKDVTEEFLDIEIRLKTKKELEARYLQLLKKANTVSEILQIEQQIGTLRSEIESVEGRLRYLKNKIGFSTLTVTFYEKIANQTEFGSKFKDGFRNGWENLIWFFVGLTNIWPFVLIFIGLIFMLISWRKKRKNRNK